MVHLSDVLEAAKYRPEFGSGSWSLGFSCGPKAMVLTCRDDESMLPFPRVPLIDLVPVDGLPSERYKQATSSLIHSLQKFSFAIVQLSATEDVLLKCVLDSARMYFHHRPTPGPESIHSEDSQDWNRTAGYYTTPHYGKEIYDYRPGRPVDSTELPPSGMPELFSALGTACRHVLEALAWVLDLRSCAFADLLDNVPLKEGEVSTSVLSVCCHGRPGLHQAMDLSIFEGHESYPDKGLVTLVKSDKHGLQIRDVNGRWQLADGDLGPQDMVLYCGLSLYQATGGNISPAFFKTTDIAGAGHLHMYGKCSVSFRLMPKATAILRCSTAAGVPVPSLFQPVTVHDFMQRSHQQLDQLIGSRHAVAPTFQFTASSEALKSMKKRKQVTRGKPLAPSKRLRQEAQRVLKERVQELAESKHLKIRFCGFKDCEENHLSSLDSPCAALRAELGWPHGVPFVHPHDLPNKAKQAFLEAYEPGWTTSQDELGLMDHSHQQHC